MIVICQGVRAGTREPMVLVRCACGALEWLERDDTIRVWFRRGDLYDCGVCGRGWMSVSRQATLAEALTEQEAA